MSRTRRTLESQQPDEMSRLQLVDLIDRVIKTAEKQTGYVFHMDEQLACLKDYLEIRPNRRDDILRLVREERFLLGPWYVRNNFNRCSGEVTVRNLLFGFSIAEEWGRCCRLDTISSHNGQMDQVSSGFRIQHAADPDSGNVEMKSPGELNSYLKQLNERCQNLLELQLEPLYVQLNRWTEGEEAYPSDELDYLWMELLEIQTGSVQQAAGGRYLRLLDMAEDLLRRGMKNLSLRIDRSGMDADGYFLAVANTLPYERAEMVETCLYPLSKDSFDSFGLLDERGNFVEFDLLDSNEGNREPTESIRCPERDPCHCHRIRFRTVIPGGGYRTFKLFRKSAAEELDTMVRPAPQGWSMQNEHMRVAVDSDGQVDLLDSETGIESPNIFGFEMAMGSGASAQNDPTKPAVSILENRGVRLAYDFGVTLNLSLDAGSKHLTVEVRVEQCTEDQRLRLLVHTDVHTDEDLSSQPFDCLRRKLNLNSSGPEHVKASSNCGMVSVRDWNKQMTIFNNGNHEYEHLPDSRGTIALLLMNSENKSARGPGFDRCPQNDSFKLVIRPGQASEAQLMREMQCFLVPMLSIFDAVDCRMSSAGSDMQDVVHRPNAGEAQPLPLKNGGLELDGEVVFSAFKRSHDRKAWILRFFNPAEAVAEVQTSEGYARVSDLDERTTGMDWYGTASVSAKRIVTLRF